ncbi:DUF3870 domain-containing protein [Schnuerera sp. xch1]|uniref:DUF3870 domain-containing protein n=1 Tax=Schnuerera sp. xch1 TaxID=2874283 RepID=UPI001CBB403C|nr:DUF3870 domain-containing protein [Schnuerera sp. xch1]MBZ2174575.1 DUF3870 domain-containing protein [Schnuerera sp. xch1]
MRKVRDFGEDTIYFVSYAKLPSDISATYVHKVVGVGFLINVKTGIIEDVMVTLISDLCKDFIAYLAIGCNIEKDGIDDIVKKIETRFFGYSQKAVVVATKGVYRRYLKWKEENQR